PKVSCLPKITQPSAARAPSSVVEGDRRVDLQRGSQSSNWTFGGLGIVSGARFQFSKGFLSSQLASCTCATAGDDAIPTVIDASNTRVIRPHIVRVHIESRSYSRAK